MSGIDDLFNDLLDEDLLREAAEEDARLKSSEPPAAKKPRPFLFKPAAVTKAQQQQQSVVVSSAQPTVNREYLAQFLPHLKDEPKPRAQAPPLPPAPIAAVATTTKSTVATSNLPQYRLFVGNLASETRNEALATIFKDYPSVSQIQVVLDREKEKCQGYGFVTFQDPQDMLKALREKNGKLCSSRPMQISKAKPETDPSKRYKRN
ncbi:hypothetical protein BASA81_005510 [Batrachochytrium salamandrivorans]|nr:hypothetical protein BASA81_005510 [Batrachochytrium salamandrivorans]